ncbi:MAG TPA: ISAs1 family transposase [Chloroflexia bacterium]|nr:ISAs1 family transposase [Chloroflexia bacterium]
MDSTSFALTVQLGAEPFAFPLQALIDHLSAVPESRHARGLRYPLAPLLALALLAKLAGHPTCRAIAAWAKLREADLIPFLRWPRLTMPHPTTWTRAFAPVDTAALDAQIGAFFARCRPLGPQRPGDIVLSIDGKTLRGTIPSGSTLGVHLVAAFLPECGFVLAQVEVQKKRNELAAVPTLLALLDLHGLVVTGDALFAQRALSAQIVAAGGDYLWKVKGNQAGLRDEIAWLFAPLQAGEREADFDWRRARRVTKGHGRLEERELIASRALKGYNDWPGLEQVFQIQTHITYSNGKQTTSTQYGVTSLTVREASPARLLAVTLAHWGIEGGLHQKRDVSLHEDRGQVRTGHAAHVLASLNNAVIGLAAQVGEANLADAQRGFGYRFDKAMHYHNCGQSRTAATDAGAEAAAAPRLTLVRGGLAPAA